MNKIAIFIGPNDNGLSYGMTGEITNYRGLKHSFIFNPHITDESNFPRFVGGGYVIKESFLYIPKQIEFKKA